MAILTPTFATDWKEVVQPVPGWVISEYRFSANPALNDVISMFAAPFHGYRWADWWVAMEQVDTNGAPAVVWDIGQINGGGTAITDTSTSPAWALNVATLGRTAGNQPSHYRAQNGGHLVSRGRDVAVGLHYKTSAATPAFAGKRVWMGLLLAPI